MRQQSIREIRSAFFSSARSTFWRKCRHRVPTKLTFLIKFVFFFFFFPRKKFSFKKRHTDTKKSLRAPGKKQWQVKEPQNRIPQIGNCVRNKFQHRFDVAIVIHPPAIEKKVPGGGRSTLSANEAMEIKKQDFDFGSPCRSFSQLRLFFHPSEDSLDFFLLPFIFLFFLFSPVENAKWSRFFSLVGSITNFASSFPNKWLNLPRHLWPMPTPPAC